MRVKIPEFKSQKELFAYLIANKDEIIRDKKSLVIKSDTMSAGPITHDNEGMQVKAMGNDGFQVKEGSLIVDVIANLSNFCDSYMDVMLPDSWAKSIKEKGANIPFLHDHKWDVMAKIAKTLAVYAMNVTMKELGIKSDVKEAQALIFKGELRPDINDKMYNFYRNGMVNQHSIGLQYMQIELAINDPDEKEAYKVWNKYFSGIINKDYVEKKGYFWAVKEAKIYENSAVLYGANEMTPTLSTEEKSLEEGPEKSTHKENEPNKLGWEHLKNVKM
jgi:hypothetical protein